MRSDKILVSASEKQYGVEMTALSTLGKNMSEALDVMEGVLAPLRTSAGIA